MTTTEPSLSDFISEGFKIVPSDSIPYISLDNQRRFYINTTARRLMNVKPFARLAVAYRPDSQELAIVRPSADASAEVSALLATSQYNVDKRYYMSARHFVKEYGYATEQAPYFFDYQHGKSDGTLFVFRLRDERN